MNHQSKPEEPNQDEPPTTDQRTGMHPALKVLLIILLGIPAILIVLVLLVLGVCFLGQV